MLAQIQSYVTNLTNVTIVTIVTLLQCYIYCSCLLWTCVFFSFVLGFNQQMCRIVFGKRGVQIKHNDIFIKDKHTAVLIVKASKKIELEYSHAQTGPVYDEQIILELIKQKSSEINEIIASEMSCRGWRMISHWFHCYDVTFRSMNTIGCVYKKTGCFFF